MGWSPRIFYDQAPGDMMTASLVAAPHRAAPRRDDRLRVSGGQAEAHGAIPGGVERVYRAMISACVEAELRHWQRRRSAPARCIESGSSK